MMEDRLQERLEKLEKRVSRLEAGAEIENLMAKHYFLLSSGQGRRIVPELWTERDDASIEIGASGVYGARWKVITFYVSEQVPGCMLTCGAFNRWLRISDNGEEARGLWMTACTETDAGDLGNAAPGEEDQRRILLSSETPDGKKYRAEILLQAHEVCFIKEHGKWKIRNLHAHEFFRCPAGSDWVTYAGKRQVTDGMWLEAMFETPDPIPSFENLPSGPSTSHWQYDVNALPADRKEWEMRDE